MTKFKVTLATEYQEMISGSRWDISELGELIIYDEKGLKKAYARGVWTMIQRVDHD